MHFVLAIVVTTTFFSLLEMIIILNYFNHFHIHILYDTDTLFQTDVVTHPVHFVGPSVSSSNCWSGLLKIFEYLKLFRSTHFENLLY